jgi:plasmid stabilization system protein ParE
MVNKVIFSQTAHRDLGNIINYLRKEASDQAAHNFAKKMKTQIALLEKYPDIGRPSAKSKYIRSVRIDKYRHLFYRLKGSTLYIVRFFDSRQDPKKRPY